MANLGPQAIHGQKEIEEKTIKREQPELRGVYERVKGSGVWWIRYAKDDGKIRRERAGTRSAAVTLYQKRKTEVFEGRKLPEKMRARVVRFKELADDATEYVKANNEGHQSDVYRIDTLRERFGDNDASKISIEDLRKWFNAQDWQPGTYNRCRTVLYGIYRLGTENRKVTSNPAQLLKRRREPDGRVRFLNQYEPDEEVRLREVIAAKYALHMPELDIALHTGMRRSEQYLRINRTCVDLLRRDLYIPQTKNGNSRHVQLNAVAIAAFQELFARHPDEEGVIFISKGGERLVGPRHWFEDAVEEAKVRNFTWHDLRHTFASRLVMNGVHLRSVAELLGHKKIQMTMRYAHLAPQHNMAAVDTLVTNGSVLLNLESSAAPSTKQHHGAQSN